MNYRRLYEKIIENRKQTPADGYTEKHHIIPRSLGGSNDTENLVNLTAREHFLCHYLLAKMYKKESLKWYKMFHAFMMMKLKSYTQKRYFNSRLYEALRTNFSSVMSKNQSGKGNSQYGKMWICNIELKESKKIKKTDSIPEGWIKGRNKWIQFQKEQQLNEQKHTERKTRKEQKYKEALHYWNLFKNGNYKSIGEFCKKEYPNSKVYLCKLWKLHISEFNPQKGKPFKI